MEDVYILEGDGVNKGSECKSIKSHTFGQFQPGIRRPTYLRKASIKPNDDLTKAIIKGPEALRSLIKAEVEKELRSSHINLADVSSNQTKYIDLTDGDSGVIGVNSNVKEQNNSVSPLIDLTDEGSNEMETKRPTCLSASIDSTEKVSNVQQDNYSITPLIDLTSEDMNSVAEGNKENTDSNTTTPQRTVDDTEIETCQILLAQMLKLSREQKTEENVRKLIQELVDTKVEPEQFLDRVVRLLNGNSAKTSQIKSTSFLKRTLPRLRQSMVTKELVIDGIRPPQVDVVLKTAAPTESQQTYQATSQVATSSADTDREKCCKILANLLDLSSRESNKVASIVQHLVQALIDSKIEPEDFCHEIGKVLKTKPNNRLSLVLFLKRSLPLLRQSMVSRKIVMIGIKPPPTIDVFNAAAPIEFQKMVQRSLPPLRQSMLSKKVVIDGIKPPPANVVIDGIRPPPANVVIDGIRPPPANVVIDGIRPPPANVVIDGIRPPPANVVIDGIRPPPANVVIDGFRPPPANVVIDGIRPPPANVVIDGIRPPPANVVSNTEFQQAVQTPLHSQSITAMKAAQQSQSITTSTVMSMQQKSTSSNPNRPELRLDFCQVCQLCFGVSLWSCQSHINGKRHRKNLIRWRSKGDRGDYHCELCKVTCPNHDAYSLHRFSEQHKQASSVNKKLLHSQNHKAVVFFGKKKMPYSEPHPKKLNKICAETTAEPPLQWRTDRVPPNTHVEHSHPYNDFQERDQIRAQGFLRKKVYFSGPTPNNHNTGTSSDNNKSSRQPRNLESKLDGSDKPKSQGLTFPSKDKNDNGNHNNNNKLSKEPNEPLRKHDESNKVKDQGPISVAQNNSSLKVIGTLLSDNNNKNNGQIIDQSLISQKKQEDINTNCNYNSGSPKGCKRKLDKSDIPREHGLTSSFIQNNENGRNQNYSKLNSQSVDSLKSCREPEQNKKHSSSLSQEKRDDTTQNDNERLSRCSSDHHRRSHKSNGDHKSDKNSNKSPRSSLRERCSMDIRLMACKSRIRQRNIFRKQVDQTFDPEEEELNFQRNLPKLRAQVANRILQTYKTLDVYKPKNNLPFTNNVSNEVSLLYVSEAPSNSFSHSNNIENVSNNDENSVSLIHMSDNNDPLRLSTYRPIDNVVKSKDLEEGVLIHIPEPNSDFATVPGNYHEWMTSNSVPKTSFFLKNNLLVNTKKSATQGNKAVKDSLLSIERFDPTKQAIHKSNASKETLPLIKTHNSAKEADTHHDCVSEQPKLNAPNSSKHSGNASSLSNGPSKIAVLSVEEIHELNRISTIPTSENELSLDEENEITLDLNSELSWYEDTELSNQENYLGSDLESDVGLDLEDELSFDPKNELILDLENEVVSDLENEVVSDLENEVVSDLENEVVSDLENEVVSYLENEVVSDLENEVVSDLENEVVSDLENEVVSDLEYEVSLKQEQDLNADQHHKTSAEKAEIEKLFDLEEHADTPPEAVANLGDTNTTQVPVYVSQVQESRRPVARSVVDTLKCDECTSWVLSWEVLFCKCRLICKSCWSSQDICDKCQMVFKADIRLSNLYKRLSNVISHPCPYRGCDKTVRPGSTHQQNCQFVPVKCFKCEELVPKALLREHYDRSHPRQVLKDSNEDVKFEDFMMVEGVRDKRVVFYEKNGMCTSVYLNKTSNEWSFSAAVTATGEIHYNIFVSFEFKVEGKSYTHSCSKDPIKIDELSASNEMEKVSIPLDVYNDWYRGKSQLKIKFVVKRRRTYNNQSAKRRRTEESSAFEDVTN